MAEKSLYSLIRMLLVATLLAIAVGTLPLEQAFGATLVRSESPVLKIVRDKVTFEEWVSLLQNRAGNVIELRDAWRMPLAPSQHIYFAGGGLRSLIHQLNENLTRETPEQVLSESSVSIEDLIISGADRDVILDFDVDEDWAKENLEGWDVLKKNFATASQEAGGPAIEKVGVDPHGYRDPYNALRELYNGRLTFVNAPEKDFAKFRGNSSSLLRQNTKIALVLRHLRFLILFKEVAVTKADLQFLKDVVKSELEIPGSLPEDNFWVNKALKKFFIQARAEGWDKKAILDFLREVDLLEPLAIQGYEFSDRQKLLDLLSNQEIERLALRKAEDFAKKKPKIKDIQEFKRKNSRDTEMILAMMKATLKDAKTAADFLEILSPGVPHVSDKYSKELSKLWASEANHFASLRPTEKQVEQFKTQCGREYGIATVMAALKNQGDIPVEKPGLCSRILGFLR